MNIVPRLHRASFFAAVGLAVWLASDALGGDGHSVASHSGRPVRPVIRLTGSPRVVPDKKKRANALSNQKNSAVVKKLNAVLETLSKAELDYQGHRVRAMNEIGLAILHMTPQRPGTKLPNPAEVYLSNAKGPGEAKNASTLKTGSNGFVREALKVLNEIETHLAIMATTNQQIRADGSVKKAIQELNLALATP